MESSLEVIELQQEEAISLVKLLFDCMEREPSHGDEGDDASLLEEESVSELAALQADIAEDDAYKLICDGGVSPAWIIGHLGLVANNVITMCGGQPKIDTIFKTKQNNTFNINSYV